MGMVTALCKTTNDEPDISVTLPGIEAGAPPFCVPPIAEAIAEAMIPSVLTDARFVAALPGGAGLGVGMGLPSCRVVCGPTSSVIAGGGFGGKFSGVDFGGVILAVDSAGGERVVGFGTGLLGLVG